MKQLTALILAIFICSAVNAQEEFVPVQAKFLTKFSFIHLTGGIIIVHAQLDKIDDTLNFILDTGSGGISLDSSTVNKYGLTIVPSTKQIRGIAGTKTVSFTEAHTLHFEGLDVNNINFHINDYELLTSVYGIKIDGIMGYGLLRRYIVWINYDLQELSFYSPGDFKYPKGGCMLKPDFSTLPLQDATVGDERKVGTRLIFDTGAGLCLLLSSDFVSDSSILKKKRKIYATQAEGLGGKALMNLTILKSFSIGRYKFRDVPTYIFEDANNVTSYPSLGGLVGNDLMRRFNIIINYPERSIYIKPNNSFDSPFDYSYSGLAIYLIDGKIVVDDIMIDSPGEKAGFKHGDVIIGVDKDFSNNIQSYKLTLQKAGETIKVFIIRNGIPLELEIHIKNILN